MSRPRPSWSHLSTLLMTFILSTLPRVVSSSLRTAGVSNHYISARGVVRGIRNMTSKPRVLLLGDNQTKKEVMDELESLADVYTIPPLEHDEAAKAISKAVKENGPFVAFGGYYTPPKTFTFTWNESLIGSLGDECKLYAYPSIGTDDVDTKLITSRGAYLSNTPEEMGRRVADGTLSLVMTAFKGETPRNHACHEGLWRDIPVRSIDWRGKTVGIIGLGNIGRRFAEMADYLGMKIIYTNRRTDPSCPYDRVELDELYARSDLLLLICPLTEETRGMINRQAFEKMKDGVLIVNVGRGKVVVEQDLVDALESGKVLRAALDVFEDEPNIHEKLRSNYNVTLSPHMVFATEDVVEAVATEVTLNIIHHLQRGRPISPVNVAALHEAGFDELL